MRTVKMTTLIGRSFDRTIDILFRPFSAKKWLRLLLIAFLAGALAGGGGNGSGGGGNQRQEQKQEASKAAAQSGAAQAPAQTGAPSGAANQQKASGPSLSPAAIAGIVAAIVFFFIALFLLMTWIGSRFRFVWLNAVLNDTTSITEPYYRHRRESNSLFRFSIILFILVLLFLALDIAGTFWSMQLHGVFKQGFAWSFSIGLKIFAVPAILLICVLLGLVILAVIFDHFLVPIMAFDVSAIVPAWRKFCAIFRTQPWDIILFFLVLFALGIASGAGQAAIAFIVLIIFLLIALLVFGIPFVIIGLLLKAKIAFAIYAVVAAVPMLIIVIITLFATVLPFAVFFRLFSVNYLISLNSGYAQASLDAYSARRAEKVRGKAPIVLAIISLFMIALVFVAGLLAAIAIPNFARAREEALKKKNAAVIQTAPHVSK